MATTTEIVEGCILFCEQKIAGFRDSIHKLESGENRYQVMVEGSYEDRSKEAIVRIKSDIESFERAIERFKTHLVNLDA